MAYSDDKKLIQSVRDAAKSLGVAALWANSKKPINIETDYVFELYILFALIQDLAKSYPIKYISGTGKKEHKFPRKPAEKSGRPKFEIYSQHQVLLWQICAGTKISDIHGIKRTPDISFQKANSSDSPNHNDVELIWDTKFRKNDDDRITHHEISDFGRWLDLLTIRNTNKPTIIMISYDKMVANCLITNGNESTEPDVERIRLDLKEVKSFFPGDNFDVLPH